METRHEIDAALCLACGSCTKVCFARILSLEEREGRMQAVAMKERTSSCMRCGQCMAVYPTAAMHVEGMEYGRDLVDLPERGLDAAVLERFLMTRR